VTKTAADHAREQNFGPLWQLKQNLESKKISFREQVASQERAAKAVVTLAAEIAEYEAAIKKLESDGGD
jgi:hypothetical protein